MKQKEIRKGIDNIVYSSPSGYSLTDAILKYLHSQGVVIKVDRELPVNTTREVIAGDMARSMELRKVGDAYYKKAQQELLKAGYVAVESLIEESK